MGKDPKVREHGSGEFHYRGRELLKIEVHPKLPSEFPAMSKKFLPGIRALRVTLRIQTTSLKKNLIKRKASWMLSAESEHDKSISIV